MPVKRDCNLYRLRWIDRFGAVDAVAEPIHASCDVDAIRRAEAMAEGDRAKLWQEMRLVARIEPAPTLRRLH